MGKEIGVKDIMVVFDLAIYVRWQKQKEPNKVVIRLGAFHTVCTFIAVIGKRFKCSGFEDILIESDVIASGSVKGIIEGKHYNRAVRAHKIVSEALWRLKWEKFGNWLMLNEHPIINDMELLEAIKQIRSQPSEMTLNTLLRMRCFEELFALVKEFNSTLNTPMALYWSSYLEMVDLMLCFICASREGCWNLHLSFLCDMLQWFQAYDRTNYSRYSALYWSEMVVLEESHPEAYKAVKAGNFAVQRSSKRAFSQTPN